VEVSHGSHVGSPPAPAESLPGGRHFLPKEKKTKKKREENIIKKEIKKKEKKFEDFTD